MGGLKIREARKAAKMTQEQLSQAIGINRATLSKYESGTIDPPTSQIQAIAAALGVHPGDLMGLKDYGDNIWGPEGLTSDDLDNIRQQTLAISENQKALKRLKERMKKKEHIAGKLELLNDDGLDTAVQAIDVIVGNPRLSTYPSSPPYFQPTTTPQSPPAPQESKDTTPPQNPPETPLEGE